MLVSVWLLALLLQLLKTSASFSHAIQPEKAVTYALPAFMDADAELFTEFILTTTSPTPLAIRYIFHIPGWMNNSSIFILAKNELKIFNSKDEMINNKEGAKTCLYIFEGITMFTINAFLLNRRYSMAAYLAFPVSEWGREYHVVTLYDKPVLQIVSNSRTKVSVKFLLSPTSSTFAFNDQIVGDEDEITSEIFRYQCLDFTWSLQGKVKSLTGTSVKSEKPVGVIAGSLGSIAPTDSCLDAPIEKVTCDSALEMLDPIQKYGTDFIIVHLLDELTQGVSIIVSGYDKTRVEVSSKTTEQTTEINRRGDTITFPIKTTPCRLKSDKGIMVVFVQASSCQQDDLIGRPNLCNVVPTSKFYHEYAFAVTSGQRSTLRLTVALVVRTLEVDTVLLNGKLLTNVTYKEIVDYKDWVSVIFSVDAYVAYLIQSVETNGFGCYLFGIDADRSFMSTSGFMPMPEVTADEDPGQKDACTESRKIPACHCLTKKCGASGECLHGTKCEPGWFGAGCLYRDYASEANTTRGEFTDNDDSTCTSIVHKSLTLEFGEMITFSWMRVIFMWEPGTVEPNDINVSIALDGSLTWIQCKELRYVHDEGNVIDIFVTRLHKVVALMMSLGRAWQVCTINVYGGRNVAHFSKVHIPGFADTIHLSPYFNEFLNSKGKSKLTLSLSGNNTFGISLPEELQLLTLVILSGLDTNETLSFQIICKDRENIVKFEMDYVASTSQTRMFHIHFPTFEPVSSLQLLLNSGIIAICDMLVFIDCPAPFYGANCTDVCEDQCSRGLCNFDGTCHFCKGTTDHRTCEEEGNTTTTATLKGKSTTVKDEITEQVTHTYTSCGNGNIGKKCKNLCNCEKGLCDSNGACMEGTHCVKPWFSHACQYFDVAATSTLAHHYLNDHNDTTCYNATNNQVTARLSRPILFTWVKIVFEEAAKISNLSLHVVPVLLNEKRLIDDCTYQRTIELKPGDFDIYCRNLDIIDELTLTWTGRGSVCSLYVNDGRSFSSISTFKLPQLVNNTDISEVMLVALADDVVDTKECLHLDDSGTRSLELHLEQPRSISRIDLRINSSDDVRFEYSLQLFQDQDGSVIFVHKATGKNHTGYINPVLAEQYVIKLTLNVTLGSMNICHFEVFGECPPPSFGLECEETCMMTCQKEVCSFIGICHQCYAKRYGSFCMEGAKDVIFYHDFDYRKNFSVLSTNTTKNVSILYGFIPFGLAILCLCSLTRCNVKSKRKRVRTDSQIPKITTPEVIPMSVDVDLPLTCSDLNVLTKPVSPSHSESISMSMSMTSCASKEM